MPTEQKQLNFSMLQKIAATLHVHIVKLPDTAVCNNTFHTKQDEEGRLLFFYPPFISAPTVHQHL